MSENPSSNPSKKCQGVKGPHIIISYREVCAGADIKFLPRQGAQ